MTDFLSELAGALEDQFGLGENENHTLDIVEGGTTLRYGKLGDFAKKFDQTAERKYVEDGFLRLDSYNVVPKQFEILMQEPDVTVLVKKRAFSSLSENFRIDHMDKDEKLFFKATKILFQNKCRQISALEKLHKVNRISKEVGQLSDQIMPLVISLVDGIGSIGSDDNLTDVLDGSIDVSGGLSKLKNTIDKIRKVYSFTNASLYTSWLADISNPFKSQFGQGTGVIELTNVLNVSTTTSTDFGGGSCNFTITDPYGLMRVTSHDIERALSDATNQVYNKKTFQLGKESMDASIARFTKQLNDKRAARGANAIQFTINPDTLLGKKVRAIIDGVGIEIQFTYDPALGLSGIVPGLGGVTVSEEFLRGGPEVGQDGLDNVKSNVTTNNETGVSIKRLVSSSELSLFSDVIEKIFTSLQLKQNSQSITQQNSEVTNYARRKLRLHYLGKQIVQPMDQVHVYMGSKSRFDSKINGGLKNMFTGLGFLQNLNNSIFNTKNQIDSLFNPSGNASFQVEKAIFAGPDFPNWLWTLMRNHFVNDSGGAHVFGGVVKVAQGQFGPGGYSVNVDCADNTYYFDLGRVNMKPSIDVFNGPLLDPLTPFKSRSGSLTGLSKSKNPELLQENKELLEQKVARFKAGPNAGKLVTQGNIGQDYEIQKSNPTIKKIFYSPDGFVYRWKEGIGTLTKFSNAFNILGDNEVGSPNLAKDAFAGQDIMNTLSLLITGIPYNYSTFFKAARTLDNYGRDPQTGEDGAYSFYQSLTTDLQKNNLLWGNFIPFKQLVMDEKSFSQVIKSQFTIQNNNELIEKKILEIQDLNNKLKFFEGTPVLDAGNNSLRDGIKSKLVEAQNTLNKLYGGIVEELKTSKQYLTIAGDDVSFNFDEYLNNNPSSSKGLSDPSVRQDIRRRLNYLTRRMGWQVRGNEDKNLLIVDDSYDKDYDITAFEQALGDLSLFNSDYISVAGKIKSTAQLLDLEVFCDTQGHIRVRPPQYNRVPSSVFYRLLQLKRSMGIQLFPQFIEDMFEDQIKSLVEQIEIIEDQIRIDGALLGKYTDSEVISLIRGLSDVSNFHHGDPFVFLSDDSGTILELKNIFSESDPDKKLALKDNAITARITGQASLTTVFDTVTRAKFLVSQGLGQQQAADKALSNDRINKIINERLYPKTGQQYNLDNFLSKSVDGAISAPPIKMVDAFKVTKDLSEKIYQRQKLIKLAANALKNAQEVISLDEDDSSTATKLLAPEFSKKSGVPKVFESMIEDESFDDLGPGSGERYVIKRSQIISYVVKEEPPAHTMIQVNGLLNTFLPNSSLPTGLNLAFTPGSSEGNALVTATAIDYDMWRMYGFRSTQSVSVPFLSDPDSQCAPYALSLLNRARQNILNCELTIAGNEYMQPGEVVYVEDLELLFYVRSVQHTFSYGSSFTTRLSLTYGHSAGEYIPTTLDIIGKLLYKNRDASTYVNYRQNSAFNDKSLGVFVLDKRVSSGSVEDIITQGNFGEQNIKLLNEILFTTQFAMNSNKDPNSQVKAKVQLRIYGNGSVDSTLQSGASAIYNILTGQQNLDSKSIVGKTNITLAKDEVEIVLVDVSKEDQTLSPSQRAVDTVRNLQGSIGSSFGTTSKITTVLYGYIIDCWVSFTSNTKSG